MSINTENELSDTNEIENFIGDHLEIKNIIIHQLLKTAGKDEVNDKMARGNIAITIRERKFIGELDKSYHKKSSPIYGIFGGEFPDFRENLEKYHVNNEINFYDFSKVIMENYKKILKMTIPATGGFMLLCEYKNTRTNKDLLLVLMINNKDGYVIDEATLSLTDIQNLDIHKVDVACLINLSDWQIITNNLQTDRVTYLSFVKGLKNVSLYFMKFIDVDNKTTSKESTERLVKALQDYANSFISDREERISILDSVHNYCIYQLENKKEILLDSVARIINEEDPEDFIEFATEPEYAVSAVISGERNSLKAIKYISYSDSKFKIVFDNNELDKTIFYDKDTEILTIKDIPDELKASIMAFYSDEN